MKKWPATLYRNRHFLVFIFLFAYVQSIYMRITIWQEINAYTFTPEAAISTVFKAAILFAITIYFIRKWQKSDVFSSREMLKIFGCSLMAFLVVMKILGFIVAFLFDTIDRNFNKETFSISMFSDFLDGFVYGSFFLAYYYYNKSKNHQVQLAAYDRALSESRIYQLRSQLNPHFLFNNLNVLDQLIAEDKHQASEFLNEFAEVYRYVLQASEKKLISLEEELAFAQQYFGIVKQKYGNAYQLIVESKSTSGYIVPMTLQLLIENAVQHNLGTEENPVFITIRVTDNIHVVNNMSLKRNVKSTFGRALNNVTEQYKLLTERPVEIRQTDNNFLVIIPIIHTNSI